MAAAESSESTLIGTHCETLNNDDKKPASRGRPQGMWRPQRAAPKLPSSTAMAARSPVRPEASVAVQGLQLSAARLGGDERSVCRPVPHPLPSYSTARRPRRYIFSAGNKYSY